VTDPGKPIRLATTGSTTTQTATELADRIKDIIYEYDGVSLAVALGCMEIVKHELIQEHQ